MGERGRRAVTVGRPPLKPTHTATGLKVRYFAADFVTFITKLFWNIRGEFGRPPKRFSVVRAQGEVRSFRFIFYFIFNRYINHLHILRYFVRDFIL